MYKLIACDLDETLLSLDRTISKKNIQAIKKLNELGIHFVPSTGRGYATVENTLKELGLDNKENEYVLSFNGGYITENKDNRILYSNHLSFNIANALYKKGLEYDVCIHIYTKDMCYIYKLTQDEIDYLANRMPIKEIFEDNLDFLKDEEIIKCIYMNTNYDYLSDIANKLGPIAEELDISYSSNRYLELNPKGISKGTGLLKLCELLDIDIKDTIAIGDNFNDLSMIEVAGLGVAVNNAALGVKEKSDYVCEGTCDEDAIYEVINKFIPEE